MKNLLLPFFFFLLFISFAQAPGIRRREGSGLGLSIVKALVTSQGGSVSTGQSERGGALFTVQFPRY